MLNLISIILLKNVATKWYYVYSSMGVSTETRERRKIGAIAPQKIDSVQFLYPCEIRFY